MKRGNQYPERASDQLALLLLDFGLVERVKIADWQLNAQHENQMAAAAHQGLQIRAGPKWYSQEPRRRDQPSGGDRLFTGWNLLGTDDWQLRRHPVFLHNIIDRDTIDGEVSERVATKREVQDIQMDAMKRRRLK